jgi:hypothetical protein
MMALLRLLKVYSKSLMLKKRRSLPPEIKSADKLSVKPLKREASPLKNWNVKMLKLLWLRKRLRSRKRRTTPELKLMKSIAERKPLLTLRNRSVLNFLKRKRQSVKLTVNFNARKKSPELKITLLELSVPRSWLRNIRLSKKCRLKNYLKVKLSKRLTWINNRRSLKLP